MIRPEENLGGAGGFHAGVEAAYEQGYDRIWLMDDDVVPAPDCLDILMAVDEDCLMAVREDTSGQLVEKAAITFDLRNPLRLKPKTAMVETTYGARARMPELVEIEVVAFEGFLVRRRVVDAIGLPDPGYFIFYDDVDFAIRARRAGFKIWAVRDAVLVRQLEFDQQHDLSGLEGLLHVPQPLHRPPAVRRERDGPRQALADHRGRGRALASPRRPRRGAQRPPGAQGRAGRCPHG